MHRLIMKCNNSQFVDHIGGKNTRNDNRKNNLRIVNISENSMNRNISTNNTSGTTGVVYSKNDKCWKAFISINKKKKWLGNFKTKEEAIQVRKNAEQKYYKEYCYDNSQKKYKESLGIYKNDEETT